MFDMITVTVVGTLVALAALAGFLFWLVRVVSHTIGETQPPATHPELYATVTADIARLDLETKEALAQLTAAVAHGIDHVDRNEKRVRGIVNGAIRRFQNSDHYDAAVDAEADSLPDGDGTEGEGQGVLPLSEDVGAIDPAWNAVPGIGR